MQLELQARMNYHAKKIALADTNCTKYCNLRIGASVGSHVDSELTSPELSILGTSETSSCHLHGRGELDNDVERYGLRENESYSSRPVENHGSVEGYQVDAGNYETDGKVPQNGESNERGGDLYCHSQL